MPNEDFAGTDTAVSDSAPSLPSDPQPDSFNTFIRKQYGFIRRVASRFGVGVPDVDDVAQRVTLTIWHKLPRVRRGAERAFVRALVRSEASHLRRTHLRRREVALVLDEEVPATERVRPDERFQLFEVLDASKTALESLREELRVVFYLFASRGYSCLEIARVLELPLGTVKSRLREARSQLADSLARTVDSI
ncbi:MAG TPA: RNA polymerase sigma factor [Polyangiaceae bacterium]|nr:RNA polymerase sigma factor [Polyangiaceae bacterium]